MELEQQKEEFRKRGFGVAALTYDSTALLRDFAERKRISYPLLADPESKVIRAFDILNDNFPPEHAWYGVPFPGTYHISAQGLVLAKFFEEDHRERFTASSVLVRYFQTSAGAPALQAETDHLKLSGWASDSVVRAGNRIVLVLDVELKPKMHVYAPGVEGGYIPIEWAMPESKGWLVHPVELPPARKVYLAPIRETVPVFEKRFRLTRDLTIGQSQEIAPLLSGESQLLVECSFRYQACDDKTCYAPRTVPLKWVFGTDRHDTRRAPPALQRQGKQ